MLYTLPFSSNHDLAIHLLVSCLEGNISKDKIKKYRPLAFSLVISAFALVVFPPSALALIFPPYRSLYNFKLAEDLGK